MIEERWTAGQVLCLPLREMEVQFEPPQIISTKNCLSSE